MARRVQIAAAAMALIGLLFVGWIYVPRHHGGPLGDGAGDRLCFPANQEPESGLGWLILRNAGGADVRLTSISLVDGENLSIEEAWLVPISGTMMVGSWAGWPPSAGRIAEMGQGWEQRRRLIGAVIPPDEESPQTTWNVLVRARRSDLRAPGSTNGFEIDYVSRGIRYRSELGIHHILSPATDCKAY